MLLVDFIEHVQTVNAVGCCRALDKQKEVVCWKRAQCLCKDVMMIYDNGDANIRRFPKRKHLAFLEWAAVS